jgi:hypothetical protein
MLNRPVKHEIPDTPVEHRLSLSMASATRTAATSHIRAFLRFMHWAGHHPHDLAGVVPRTPHWRLAHLPPRLSWDDVRRTIDAIGAVTPTDLRDRAILLLLGKGVTAIVFGSRRREAVSETVELLGILGIDGEDSDAAIHERLDDRPMRCLDSDSNVVRPLCLRGKPVDHYADQTSATWTVCVGR